MREDAPETIAQRQRIVEALRQDGVEVEDICSFGSKIPTVFSIAHRIEYGGYRLTFRVLEPHWVAWTMYERLAGRQAMRDPFGALVWFVEWLKLKNFGIEFVLGRVETTPFRKGRDLNDARLLKYYVRWGGAEIVPIDEVPGLDADQRLAALRNGIKYVKVGVPDFCTPKERNRLRGKVHEDGAQKLE